MEALNWVSLVLPLCFKVPSYFFYSLGEQCGGGRGGRTLVSADGSFELGFFSPGMKLGWDLKSGLVWTLLAWKNWDDPSPGDFTWRMELHENPE
nr:s-locus-specific glycoprotein s13 [Quercus suber]